MIRLADAMPSCGAVSLGMPADGHAACAFNAHPDDRGECVSVAAGPHVTSELTHRLRRHLAAQVGAEGRLHCPCRSRVLESALALRLLETERGHEQSRSRLRAFLATATTHNSATPLDRTLADGALRRASRTGREVEVLSGFEHHTAVRKRMLLDTLLYLTGARDRLPRREAVAFAAGDLHSWKQPEMVACHLIHVHAHSAAEEGTSLLLEPLAAALRGGIIHERNHLSHLLYLFALRPYPQYRDLVGTGLERLLTTQGADGGFSLSRDIDTWVTSVAGLALAEAGADPLLLDRMCDWLGDQQADDGGWAFTPGVTQTDTDTTYTVLKLMHRHASHRHADALDRGRAYLLRMQNPDGGWPVYRHGNPSEAAMTGGALSVLSDGPHSNAVSLTAGAFWLTRNQQRDGTFERGWSLSEGNALFRAVHGLSAVLDRHLLTAEAVRHARRTLSRATTYIHDTQNPDGGWGHQRDRSSDPISTGYALAAIGHRGPVATLHAALGYLMSHQQSDGGFASAPDTVSPRPIPLDLPALAPAYVLRGLAHAFPGTGPTCVQSTASR
ncbi:prenyltransferase/squalene oxidase repeat-containing protein [Kitasatospora sp. NPDC001603]|uniref:prenyltransferase/squalene oxidase repeat-containing protein n=1 Tax=Kitasatospora sp. NPDC001603 TaxID=3154388 RepID=UPI0033264941